MRHSPPVSKDFALPSGLPETTRVLVIEDDPGIVRAVRDSLEGEPDLALDVRLVQTPDDLEKLPLQAAGKYQVLILDLGLPSNKPHEERWEAGLELLDQMLACGVEAVPIILTAYDQDEARIRAAYGGAIGLIAKKGPETWERLRLMVKVARAAWEGRIARREVAEIRMKFMELAARLAHDLQTPGTLMDMALGIVEAGKPLPPGLLAALREALDMFRETRAFLEDVLHGTERPPQLVDTDWPLLFKRLETLARPLDRALTAGKTQMEFRNHYYGTLRADASLLRRAVMNLIANALQALSRRNIDKPLLRVISERQASELVVRVEDNAGGMDPDEGNRGPGLGLNICREIAGVHGGAVSWEKNELGGTTAVLRLPLA